MHGQFPLAFSSKLINILLQYLHESTHVIAVALEIFAQYDQISEKFLFSLLKYVVYINAITIRAINATQISTNGIA